MADRPCEKDMYCSYEYFDYSENCAACGIDFDGENCPYVKPWGKKKYYKEQVLGELPKEEIEW